jgi:hypothetical protein
MATSGSKKIYIKSGAYIYLLFSWTAGTQNIANNYTPINWTLKIVSEGNGANISSSASKDYSVTVDGQTWKGTNTIGIAAGASKTLASGTKNVYHNADGSKTFSYSFSQEIAITYSGTTIGTKSGSGTGTLNTIPRQATVTAAPNFNDEENPTITYSNPAGTAVTSLQACIASKDGTTIYVPYRDISKAGTSYTFNLTTAERNALRNATPNNNTLAVKFYVHTVIGGNTLRSSLEKTLTIINNKPTLNPTVKDAGTASTVLTGDANKIIKGHNYISVSSGGAALKGATIQSQKITCGKEVINGASGSFTNVDSASFVFSITDSRGNTTTQTVNKTLIPYVKLTCNLNARATVDGKITLNVKGNYFNGSFGATANTLNIQYRYKENNGTYGSWINATATLSNNTYTANATITGLDYRKAYVVQAKAKDQIYDLTTNEKRVRAIPLYDWGENDFQFNVDAYDKNGVKLENEMTAENQTAVSISGKTLLESGWVSITPVANTPTSAAVKFKRTYNKIPTVVMSCATSVAGTQVLGYGQTGISTTGVNLNVTRTNTVATILYYFVFGEVDE